VLGVTRSLLTEPVATALLVIDQADGATLTEIARASGKALSTMQRAVDALIDAGVVERESPRGRIRFSSQAPRLALRDLAAWRMGEARTQALIASTRLSWIDRSEIRRAIRMTDREREAYCVADHLDSLRRDMANPAALPGQPCVAD
jgi:DNA-binding transcriptional ArsR family regulator